MDSEITTAKPKTQQENLLFGLTPLSDLIAASPYLSRLARENRSKALFNAYIYALALRAAGTNPLTAYYVGIGGGDEPIDVLSAFEKLGVDEVVGVDLLNRTGYPEEPMTTSAKIDPILGVHRHHQEVWYTRVDAMLQKQQEQGGDIHIIRADEGSAEFTYLGKRRKIKIHQGDAASFIPPIPTPIIYSKATVGLVARVPEEVLRGVNLIYNEDNLLSQQSVKTAASRHGFKEIDLSKAATILDAGRKQIVTSFPTTRLMVKL